jgi:histidinol phosphatase-like enzyme
VVQIVVFAYLTWWELSWDVMEPVAYFVSLTYSLVAYMYFLYTRSYFEQKDFNEYCECTHSSFHSAGFTAEPSLLAA